MLFQQPPRSCIGIVEKHGGVVPGPAYTEVKVRNGDHLRIGHLVNAHLSLSSYIHPLLEEGFIWWGNVYTDKDKVWEYWGLRDGALIHSKNQQEPGSLRYIYISKGL